MKKHEAKQLHDDIQKALQEVERKHNVTISAKRMSYTKTGFRVTLKGSLCKSKDQIKEQERREFENAIAGVAGIYPEDFDKEFSTHQGTYRLRGYNTRAKKYPIIGVKVGTDKRYKFPRAVIEDSEIALG